MTTNTKHYAYYYPGDSHGFYWARLFLDDRGSFSVISDCGNYGYGHFSCNSIRHFVAYVLNDPQYLLSKISKKNIIDGRQTVENVKKSIIECRRHGSATKEGARDAWDGLPAEYEMNHEAFWVQYYDFYDEDAVGCDFWEFNVEYDYPEMAYSFIKNSLPGLQALIRKELEEESCKKSLLML